MARLEIPEPLGRLLRGAAQETPILELADSVGIVLADNGTPFFPAYTDHGVRHVERVMRTAVALIPEQVWENDLLQPPDAAVLIGGCLLHDLALHVRETGFLELVCSDSRFLPLPWFKEPQPSRTRADLPWAALWSDFQREVRHLGQSRLERILGPHASGVPAVAHDDRELDPSTWVDADRLVVGEFLRRHHARLAHEIAIYGFPGTTAAEFPWLSDAAPSVADAVGLAARSHNESLRAMLEHLEYKQRGNRRTAGALLPYAMAVLRIADYMDVDADRAPPLLLRLKDPQSPVSIAEWTRHGSIATLTWDEDARTVYVEVSPRHGLRTHLALVELFADLERELDATAGMLSETYPRGRLAALRLAYRRVRTNLAEPSLREQLPYVPCDAALRNSEDLFRLVIDDLYGKHRAVAGRELLQNAVDAVRARRRQALRGADVDDGAFRSLRADVVVAVEETAPGEYVLRVTDTGVGMTPEIVTDYFLQAGASLTPDPADLEGLAATDVTRVMKTGRFGIGAFAAFLLGPLVKVTTRHLGADSGVSFVADRHGDLVELRWVDAPCGTEIEVPFSSDPESAERLLKRIADYYSLDDPAVSFEFRRRGRPRQVKPLGRTPSQGARLAPDWRELPSEGFDAVWWSPDWCPAGVRVRSPSRRPDGLVSINGIWIQREVNDYPPFTWSDEWARDHVGRPTLAVLDSRHRLGVTLHRYGLVDRTLPFEAELLEAIGTDLVGHAIACGPRPYPLGRGGALVPVHVPSGWFPLMPSLLAAHAPDGLLVVWDDEGTRLPPRRSVSLTALPETLCAARALVPPLPYGRREQWRYEIGARDMTDVWVFESERDAFLVEPRQGWREASTNGRNRPHTYVRGPHGSRTDELCRVAESLHRGREVVRLTLIDGFGAGHSADDSLARAWLAAVGGAMPSDRAARTAFKDGSDALATSISAWRRWQRIPLEPDALAAMTRNFAARS